VRAEIGLGDAFFGAEMLVETARLWEDLGFYSDAKGGKFCINGVTGPDEYNALVELPYGFMRRQIAYVEPADADRKEHAGDHKIARADVDHRRSRGCR
jgi:hypothetical protein